MKEAGVARGMGISDLQTDVPRTLCDRYTIKIDPD